MKWGWSREFQKHVGLLTDNNLKLLKMHVTQYNIQALGICRECPPTNQPIGRTGFTVGSEPVQTTLSANPFSEVVQGIHTSPPNAFTEGK